MNTSMSCGENGSDAGVQPTAAHASIWCGRGWSRALATQVTTMRGVRPLLCATLLCLLPACRESRALPEPSRWPPVAEDVAGTPYQEIGLSRTTCFGVCPVYDITYHRDGTVHYRGSEHVDYVGERRGHLPAADFVALARFVDQASFRALDDVYGRPPSSSDVPSIAVRVLYVDGSTKSVTLHDRFGPRELWALQRVLDGLMLEVQWVTAP
ncbi:MAG: DUF6438 domain-containing protein [Vicinamibacterales bacterium]